MTELFDALSVAGETVSEADRVVYLLASLPESFNVLVTALEANEDVPKLEVVTERILHQERKSKERSEVSPGTESAMTSRRHKPMRCHHCGRLGHIKRYCKDLKAEKKGQKDEKTKSQKAATTAAHESSDSESNGLIAGHALSVSSSNEQCAWIVDSGATCHMCQDIMSFTTLYQLEDPIDVVLGDGRALTAVRRGDVVLDMILPNGESKACTLHDVLYVPKLSYNFLSVAKASQKGKIVKFTMSACYKEHKMVAKATKVGSLYQLDHEPTRNGLALLTNQTQRKIFGTGALGT